MTRNPHTFIGCDAEYAESGIVIFGAPFDSTTSYRPGARFGCSAIRNESFGIETFSPYQDRDLAYMRIFDGGDLDLPFGSPEAALDAIAAQADEILGDGKIPVMLGGEHLVTLGAVRSAVRRHPDLRIVHFDAHADLRDDYLGVKLSHACVIRRCHELVGDGRIFQRRASVAPTGSSTSRAGRLPTGPGWCGPSGHPRSGSCGSQPSP